MPSDPRSVPKVTVAADRDACIGTGECRRLVPDAFDNDDDGIVVVLDAARDVNIELLRRAERACPVAAITVTSNPEQP